MPICYSRLYYNLYKHLYNQRYSDKVQAEKNSKLPKKDYYENFYKEWAGKKQERRPIERKRNDAPNVEVRSGRDEDLVIILHYEAGGAKVIRLKGRVNIYKINENLFWFQH